MANDRYSSSAAVALDAGAWSDAEGRALHAALLALTASGASRVKVAAAESLTVGRVQAELGRWSGSSGYFAGGVTAYEIAAKVRLLGVDAAHAEAVNAVSARVAEEMARGAAKLFGCEIGVATTGYAEADASRGVAEPFAWVAVVRGADVCSMPVTRAVRVDGAGLDRAAMQARAAAAALRLLAEVVAT